MIYDCENSLHVYFAKTRRFFSNINAQNILKERKKVGRKKAIKK